MAFKIFYHEDALADLEEIFEWSRDRHPETTEKFAGDLFNHIDLLSDFPWIGEQVKGRSSTRRLFHSPLYVYYRVDEARSGIEVLSVRHTARRRTL